MRQAAGVLCLALIVCTSATGCLNKWNFLRPNEKDPGEKEAPSAAQLVSYLNENAKRLQTLECNRLDLSVSSGLMLPVTLSAQMKCQQPRNFRLAASVVGNDEVDLGSNDQEFWYWVKRGPNYQFYCPHKDLAEGKVIKNMPFPFRPDLIMETLGMASYGAPERYQIVVERDKLRLSELTTSPQGTKVKKIVVFNRRPVNPPTPQMTDIILTDAVTGREICSAHIASTQLDPKEGGVFPRRVEFRWPAEKLTLGLDLKSTNVNTPIPPGSPTFVRRPLNGIPSYNLALNRIDGAPTGIQRVGIR